MLQMWYRDGGAWTEVSIAGAKVHAMTLQVAVSHPAVLTWKMLAPQHTTPIPDRADICLTESNHYDPATASDPDDPDTFTNPLFLGHVADIQPESNWVVAYEAYDPTKRAGDELMITSAAGTAEPRLVYNAPIETDDDYAFSRALDATVGEMVDDLLTDQVAALRPLMAAPLVSGDAFESSDLTPFDLVPQNKVIFETQGLRSGVDFALQHYPGYRMVFDPGARKWRFRELAAGTQHTVTLNDYSGKKVLSMNLKRSLEARYTAVEIRGPLKLNQSLAAVLSTTSAGSGAPSGQDSRLTEDWTLMEENAVLVGGPDAAGGGWAWQRWQITNPSNRALARWLPTPVSVPMSNLGQIGAITQAQAITRQPTLLATWDNGDTWETVEGATLDVARGYVTAPYRVVKLIGGTWTGPDNVIFHYAWFGAILTARAPSTGFEGTAYTVAGVENTFRRYDEMLSHGYDKNDNFISESARVAEFEKLAQNLLDASKDIAYTGGFTLQGLDFDFARLNARVNIAAKDQDGGAITTGWEAINAPVTDVEYDFTNRITTVQLTSDASEFTSTDPELIKQRLKIEALNPTRQRGTIEFVFNGQLIYTSTFNFADLGEGEFQPLEPI